MAETTATTLAAVEFHGATLVTTLVDGVPSVALRPVCEAIGLDWAAQYQRIGRDPVLSSTVVVTTTVAEDGKRREMTCLPLKHLNGWLFGVDANRVAPEVRDRLIEYQRECYDVLADYWQKGSATNPRGAAALVGQSTGMPTAQLIALQDQSWKLEERLEKTTSRERRAKLYEQLQAVYRDMGMTAPALTAIGHEAPDEPAEVAAFWAMFNTLQAAGHRLNHSRNPGTVAINLNEVHEVARKAGVRPMDTARLKRLLPLSQNPRFAGKGQSISSAFKTRELPDGQTVPATVHAWIFEGAEGGAA